MIRELQMHVIIQPTITDIVTPMHGLGASLHILVEAVNVTITLGMGLAPGFRDSLILTLDIMAHQSALQPVIMHVR